MDLARMHNLAISDTGFVFDPVTGNSFTSNETGIIIINLLKKGFDISQIAQHLCDEYDIDGANAEHDVVSLIELLRSHELVN